MKNPAILALIALALTACQTFNLDFLKPKSDEPVEEHIPDDSKLAQLYQQMKANRARMKSENPQSKISHKTIISELVPGEQADVEIELDAGIPYVLFANCADTCRDLDLALTRSDNLQQTLTADTSGDTPAPVLRYTPDRSGKYRASIIMASCRAASCAYSLQIFESPQGVPQH